MNYSRSKTSLVLLIVLVLRMQAGFAQADSVSKAVQDNYLQDKQKEGKNLVAYADSAQMQDSLQLHEIQRQIVDLKSKDAEKRAALVAKLDSIKNSQAKKTAIIKAQVDSLRANTVGVPVVLFNDTLFYIYANLGPFTPRQRANTITSKLETLVDDHQYNASDLVVYNGPESADVMHGSIIVLSITDRDAFWQDKTRSAAANFFIEQIKTSIAKHQEETSARTILFRVLKVIVVFTLLFFGVKYMNKGFTFLNQRLLFRGNKYIIGIKIKEYEFLSISQEKRMLAWVLKMIKWLAIAIVIYLALPVIFSIFPNTEGIAKTLIGYVLNPLIDFGNAFLNYISELITIVVILFLTHYFVRFLKFLAIEVEQGKLVIKGFFLEWAMPTFRLLRIMVFAFAFIIIFPFLPGSDSPAFKGVSVFLGILISLGSSSAISNIIAGLVITYMRAFKIGDRVKIGDTVGDVISKTMLVTHVRTIKNEDVTIPNAAVLNGSTINYSSSAKDLGLILNTTVTIGYDVPWNKVHEMLIDAALKTPKIEHEPVPFVLQTSLDDFYVSYQINGVTREASSAARIYSDLHANIQNAFNEAGIEILSPHYRAARDGNNIAIPPSYVPKDYKAPTFGVKLDKE